MKSLETLESLHNYVCNVEGETRMKRKIQEDPLIFCMVAIALYRGGGVKKLKKKTVDVLNGCSTVQSFW